MLIFLTQSQSQQWLTWCAEENVDLKPTNVSVVPLSVNDELAFVAGIPCSLNTPSSGPETMLEKRKVLRNAVREEMGLKDSDVVVMSLSSIHGGKGQLLLLEAAQMVVEKQLSGYDSGSLLCKIAALLHPFAAILAQLWFFFFGFYLKDERREDETVGLHNAARFGGSQTCCQIWRGSNLAASLATRGRAFCNIFCRSFDYHKGINTPCDLALTHNHNSCN